MFKFSVGILRVSGAKQDIEINRAALLKEIASRGLNPVPFNIFKLAPGGLCPTQNTCVIVEDHVTGRTANRKTYKWVLAQVSAGRVQSVIVPRADRLGRNLGDSVTFAKGCVATKTELFSLKERIDYISASGKFQFAVLAAAAEFESDLISERVRAAYVHLKEEAEKNGTVFNWGGRPLGCTNKATAEQLPDLKLMIAEGKSVRHMVRVTGMDYKTIRKWRKRILAGETWTVAKD